MKYSTVYVEMDVHKETFSLSADIVNNGWQFFLKDFHP